MCYGVCPRGKQLILRLFRLYLTLRYETSEVFFYEIHVTLRLSQTFQTFADFCWLFLSQRCSRIRSRSRSHSLRLEISLKKPLKFRKSVKSVKALRSPEKSLWSLIDSDKVDISAVVYPLHLSARHVDLVDCQCGTITELFDSVCQAGWPHRHKTANTVRG